MQHGADDGRSNRHEKSDEDTKGEQTQRHKEAIDQLLADIHVMQAGPEIAERQSAQPEPILHEKWLVEAQRMRHPFEHLRRRRRLHQAEFLKRVSSQADDHEHQECRDQQHWYHD